MAELVKVSPDDFMDDVDTGDTIQVGDEFYRAGLVVAHGDIRTLQLLTNEEYDAQYGKQ